MTMNKQKTKEEVIGAFVIITEYNGATQGFLVASVDKIINMNWEHIHLPFHYVILSFINYFFTDKEQIRFIFCLISLSAPILFYLGLKTTYFL